MAFTETFTPGQKEIWEAIAPFFEEEEKVYMSFYLEPNKPTKIVFDFRGEGFRDTIIKGTTDKKINSFRTPEEQKDLRDNKFTLVREIITNGSSQINVKLYNS